MESPIHTENRLGLTLKIYSDDNAISPADDADKAGFIVGLDRRNFWVECPTNAAPRKEYHVFPIEAYIHSGIRLYLSGGCAIDRQWDVSQVGEVFIHKTEWAGKKITRRQALKYAKSLIETWNQYLNGEVYGYYIEDKDRNHLGSCWGFYGEWDGKDGVLENGRAELDAIFEGMKKELSGVLN